MYLRIFALLLSACSIIPRSVMGQSTLHDDVHNVVTTLFKGMEKGDSALVHSTFDRKATLATIFKDKAGKVVLRREDSIDGFLKAVGTPHKETWFEEFWNLKTNFDGDFALAWCEYAFYVDNTFSHCGVDAIQLYRTPEGWKIFHMADTRRKTDCKVPQEIQDKHK
jgi:hypothetical protein